MCDASDMFVISAFALKAVPIKTQLEVTKRGNGSVRSASVPVVTLRHRRLRPAATEKRLTGIVQGGIYIFGAQLPQRTKTTGKGDRLLRSRRAWQQD